MLLDIDYSEQLEIKRRKVERVLGVKVEHLIPSPKTRYFRNRMDYVVAPNNVIGLNVRGSWRDVVDISDCLLLSPEADRIRNLFREHLRKNNIQGWDRIARKGVVRFLTIIEGKFTGERMVSIIASRYDDELRIGDFMDKLTEEKIRVDSLLVGLNTMVRDDAVAEEIKPYIGLETIREKIGENTYMLHQNTFFQPNPYTLEQLIDVVKHFINPAGWEKVLELYAGVGTFTIPISKSVSKVVAVEINCKAVEIAEHNARINKAKRIEFVNRPSEEVSVKGYDVILLDPPRSGLPSKLARRIKKHGPERIVYVSCGLEALARDVKAMGYRVEDIALVDQFPHSPLVETAVLLRRR